ncbi:MAG: GxxExxY protein [Bacteroidetes bacterium]|nr:GxxExxY protein [Bacteroidota bacterium]
MRNELLTEQIIKCFYEVYNELGYGFLERVYQNSLYLVLVKAGLKVEAQKRIKVYFRGVEVGEYFADMVVEDVVILELKAAENLIAEHESQLLHYLRSSEIEIGLLLNFGPKPSIRRKIYDNHLKKSLPPE